MDIMTVALDEKQPFLSLVDEADRQAGSARWSSLRRQGRARFRELPFPGAKTEDWRFTSVAPLLRERFALPVKTTIDASALPAACDARTLRLVFVNGAFDAALSRMNDVPAGITVG